MKVASLVDGMIAGADSLDGMALLRQDVIEYTDAVYDETRD